MLYGLKASTRDDLARPTLAESFKEVALLILVAGLLQETKNDIGNGVFLWRRLRLGLGSLANCCHIALEGSFSSQRVLHWVVFVGDNVYALPTHYQQDNPKQKIASLVKQ